MATTDSITIRLTGLYLVQAGGYIGSASSVGGRLINITLNGTNANTDCLVRQNITPNTTDIVFGYINQVYNLSNNDVLRLQVYTEITENMSGNNSRDRMYLSVIYLGEI